MNLRYILGTVTIVVIIGGTIYAIKKSKDAEKLEGEEITVEEAKAMVARGRVAEAESTYEKTYGFNPGDEEDRKVVKVRAVTEECEEDLDEDIEEIIDDSREMAEYNASFVNATRDNNEEEEELRYEPNSMDARNQFIKMELAEWRPLEDVYQTMMKLFDFPFNPQNDGDDMLRTQIIDYRVQFFGFGSKWSKEVTIADVILHYARSAEFNCGEDLRYWVAYFLDFNELDFTMASHEIDEVLSRLNSHTYFNEERQTFGLFGLTRESMDQAIRIANRNIDRSVTYELEFNEFLKSTL